MKLYASITLYANWRSSPLNADIADFFAPRKDSYRYVYPGGSFAGPILKDRLFFLASYAPTFYHAVRKIAYAAGARQYGRETLQTYGLGRLDYNPTRKLQTNTSWMWSPYRSKGVLPTADPQLVAPTNDTSVLGGYTPAQSYSAAASYSATSRLLFTARYGYKYINLKDGNYGIPGDAQIVYANASDNAPGVPVQFRGPNGFSNISDPFKIEKNIQTRHNVYLDGSYLVELLGQHTFKVGYALNRMAHDQRDGYPNGKFNIFWGDAFSRGSYSNVRGTYGYYIWEDGIKHDSQVTGHNQGVYFQDTWKLPRNITISAGVRLENEFIPPYRKEQGGLKIANPIAFDWSRKIAPRLGAAWDIHGDGRWKLAGSFGYFYDVMKYELARSVFGGETWISNIYKLDNPNVFALSSKTPEAAGAKIVSYDNRMVPINEKGELAGIDPDIKPYKTRRFVASLDHQLTGRIVIGTRYTRNDLLFALEDIGVLDANDNESYMIGTPGFGQTRDPKSVYGQKTPNGQEWLVPKATRQYDGLEFRMQGRVSNRLNLVGSYTWSRLWGNYSGLANSDEFGRSAPGVSRAFDLPYYYFDSSGDQKNKFGRLATDRPHTFKLSGSYELKSKAGSTFLGVTQLAYSGTLDSTSVLYLSAPTFPNGRGDLGRTPMYIQTDASLAHQFRVSERTTLRIEGQFINLLNQAAPITRQTQMSRSSAISAAQLPLSKFFSGYKVSDFVYPGSASPTHNPYWGRPIGYQAPRDVRIGVNLMF